MIIYLNGDGLTCGAGVEVEGYLFNLFSYNGYAQRVLTGTMAGFLPPTDDNVYIGYNGIFVDVCGTIEYHRETDQVARLGGKKAEYDSHGKLARIGNAVITGCTDRERIREQIEEYDAKHKSRNKDGWKFFQNGDIMSYNGICYEYGEYIDFGGGMPWSTRHVLSGIGDTKIAYHPDGRVRQINGRNIEYDSKGRFAKL